MGPAVVSRSRLSQTCGSSHDPSNGDVTDIVQTTRSDRRVLWPTRPDRLLILGLISVTVLVLLSTFIAPHPESFLRDRCAILSVLLVSVVASWRGTKAGVTFALSAFVLFLVIAVAKGDLARDSLDLFVDLFLFLGVAVAQGVQTGHLRQREMAIAANQRRMSLLGRFSERLVPAGDSSALHECLVELRDLVDASRVSLLLADDEHELMVQAPDDARWFAEHPEAMMLVRRVFARRAEWTDAGPGRPQQGETASREGDEGVAVPLAGSVGPLGILYVSEPRSGRYSVVELDFLGIIADRIATYLAGEQLQTAMAAAAAAEAASRLKSNLVSSVSHGLKTPLAAATATVTGLLEGVGDDDESTRREVTSAIEDLRVLDERIGDLLGISQLESTGWQPNLDWNDPADICSSVLSRLPAASRSRIRCRFPSGLPIAQFDLVQMTHALYHLVENALAYSLPDAPVVLSASADARFVRFSVEDSGPGVCEEERKSIFDKFRRGSAGSLVHGGTGLGLTIASEIVRYHGGQIRIEDVQPHGSRFVIELPREL